MAQTPPGWYDDGHGALRWWDGSQWSEFTHPQPQGMDVWRPTRNAPVPEASAEPAASTLEPPATPEEPTQAGIFAAATEPQRSRTWIAWLVVGIGMLLIVVLAAVLIPLAILGFGRVDAQSAQPQSGEEAAVVAAITGFDEAWQTSDCELFADVTTESIRAATGIVDCAEFVARTEAFRQWYSDYEIVVTDISATGTDEYTVLTHEQFQTHFENDGTPLDPPIEEFVIYEYTLVPDDNGWAIYDLVSAQ
ncbi:hypothetical protein GCM10009808_16580 [Microbacterium sediminicola]|uniref:DUF2510 domain-containing protein n=1 Tax=Microbacterium sediminicola TaxID=415210 RepID=A0ABP4U5S6_9MICO